MASCTVFTVKQRALSAGVAVTMSVRIARGTPGQMGSLLQPADPESALNNQEYPKSPARVASAWGAWSVRAAHGRDWLAMVLLAALATGGCAKPADASRDLVLATWNLEHLAADDGAGCRPRKPAEYRALRAQAERLDATLIAVQEVENVVALARVFDPSQYDLVISRRHEERAHKCRGQSGQRLTAQRTGFAIHRERLAALGLEYERQPDFSALGVAGRRYGTWITLTRADGGKPVLQVLSVHLKSGCAWGALEDRQPIRRSQCLTLRRQRGILEEWMDARIARGEAFAVLGDFNRQLDQPNDHFWNDIADGEICRWEPDEDYGRRCIRGSTKAAPDARLVLANAGQPFPFPYNKKFPYAIDHLVFDATAGAWVRRGSYQALDYPAAALSDHHPLRLQLRLPKAS
ncbi:endonuclease/exonuclease/phosphatase family protein [Thiorhodovibrio frisius]|uniref:Endonuclease/exonuclease/phosphatase family protein n=1 Tax=Thiorhodovibrio frisius TaxID=631362 RepID=H8Z061_9GAMM|nr:endonuclease/exonuclease/phosphatase family protein [Thiorhodovibrio frisius]EIC22269.1 endonuclease/exonuclease/phosphatase family protein [Thiorhodovibrio frisius]WPL24564.1 Endonuclease/Exonuclease/phosphatase family protein [Thiorhodovibrio frisius]